MRTYRVCWTLVVYLIAGVSLVLVWLRESPWLALAEVVTVGAMGLALGASWEEAPAQRWRVGGRWAMWGIVTALALIGLPHLLGPWSLLVLVALGMLSPAAVLVLTRRGRARRTPAAGVTLRGVSNDELARRWRTSSVCVRSSWRTPPEVLLIVAERQQLLDELEARDPEGFARWLVAAGWRESPHR
ncbi:MAG: hypothetical protein ACXWDL_02035 [Nocardioides sp.]